MRDRPIADYRAHAWPEAIFTYSSQQPQNFGRMPTTLLVSVPLTTRPQAVQALRAGVRGSTVIFDAPATLSAFID